MKKHFNQKPKDLQESWPGKHSILSWHSDLAAIPSTVYLATTYKSNGIPNATLMDNTSFIGTGGEFYCVLNIGSNSGHFYKTLMDEKCCVLNFISKDYYSNLRATIDNNGFDVDEISISGFTLKKAEQINAPYVDENFLGLECELLWTKALFDGSTNFVALLRCVNVMVEEDYYQKIQSGESVFKNYLLYEKQFGNVENSFL